MPDTKMLPGTAPRRGPVSAREVEGALKKVVDPELGANVVDLGLVYSLGFGKDNMLLIGMTMTSSACTLTGAIEEQVGAVLSGVVDRWRLRWVWMPPWGPDRITDDGREQMRCFNALPLSGD